MEGFTSAGTSDSSPARSAPGRVKIQTRVPEGRLNLLRLTTITLNQILARPTYPRTLTRENDNTARDEIGLPIDMAGRKVVKINILFTCGNNCCDSFGSERIL
jgi:hypothetical protein